MKALGIFLWLWWRYLCLHTSICVCVCGVIAWCLFCSFVCSRMFHSQRSYQRFHLIKCNLYQFIFSMRALSLICSFFLFFAFTRALLITASPLPVPHQSFSMITHVFKLTVATFLYSNICTNCPLSNATDNNLVSLCIESNFVSIVT